MSYLLTWNGNSHNRFIKSYDKAILELKYKRFYFEDARLHWYKPVKKYDCLYCNKGFITVMGKTRHVQTRHAE